MQLYTVHYQRKHIVDDVVTMIDETVRDLPLSTALTYCNQVGARMVAQEFTGGDTRRSRSKSGEFASTAGGWSAPKTKTRASKPAKKGKAGVADKGFADYRDLVNETMKEG